MEDKNTTYRMPEGFDPFAAANTIRGLADSIHQMVLEGPVTEARIPRGAHAGLNALVELLQEHAHELHDYLSSIENRTTLNLPMSEADFEAVHVKHVKKADSVREAPAVYLVR